MNEIKLSLSIVLPGSTLLSKEECFETTQMEKHSMKVAEEDGSNPEVITFYTRKCKPAIQSLNMSKEAYEYMTDRNSCPSWSKPSKWATMSKKERLKAHLQKTVEYLGGISYTYQVFED